jgi:AcrR family transcriptional regulator
VPRAGLSPEVIVSEAARLVDEVGRDRLTLAALAKRFGVAQPSLYKHVDGLDCLHGLLAVKVLREVGDTLRRAGTGKAGSAALRAVAKAYRAYALEHPGCYGYVLRAPSAGDDDLEAAATEILSVLNDVFAGYGITGNSAIDAARFVRSTLHGFVSLELGGGFGMPRSVDHSFGRLVAATDQALTGWTEAKPGRTPRPR